LTSARARQKRCSFYATIHLTALFISFEPWKLELWTFQKTTRIPVEFQWTKEALPGTKCSTEYTFEQAYI